jgi:hypothetical protein
LEIAGAYLKDPIYRHGVYLTEANDQFENYLQMLNSGFEKVVKFEPEEEWSYNKSLFNAWEISFNTIQARNPTAIRLLSIFGMFGTDTLDLKVLEPLTDFEPSFHSTEQGKLEIRISISLNLEV